MAILKMRRVVMHPWAWWAIVKRALQAFTKDDLNADARRRMASIMKTLDVALDPDEAVFEAPFERLSSFEVSERTKRNEEILKEDPTYGKFREARVVDGKVVHGFRPLPAPNLLLSIDFSGDDTKVIEDAIESFARSAQVARNFDPGFVLALDAIKASTEIVVDTDRGDAATAKA